MTAAPILTWQDDGYAYTDDGWTLYVKSSVLECRKGDYFALVERSDKQRFEPRRLSYGSGELHARRLADGRDPIVVTGHFATEEEARAACIEFAAGGSTLARHPTLGFVISGSRHPHL